MNMVGRYELLEELGRGGEGVVWRARDPRLRREVAIKLLLNATPRLSQRLAREGRALARLDHPGIVRILDSGETPEGAPWVALELVSGGSVQDRLDRGGPLPVAEAVAVAAAVADALTFAHAQGVVHRDVKPANVLVGQGGAPRLGDFGLAKELVSDAGASSVQGTIRGHAMGTPGYFPPEQALGDLDRLGPAADVYALGATLFALLTGRPPHEADSMMEAIAAAHGPAPRPSATRSEVDATLDGLVVAMLAVDPAQRPTMADVGRRLAAWRPARPRVPPTERAAARPRPLLPLTVGLALGLVPAAGLGWFAVRQSRELRARTATSAAAAEKAEASLREAEARTLAARARVAEVETKRREEAARADEAEARASAADERPRPAPPTRPEASVRASLLTPDVERSLAELTRGCEAAGAASMLQALRFAAMGRTWAEVGAWAQAASEAAPGCARTALLRAHLAFGRDQYAAGDEALERARGLGVDPHELDLLAGLLLWFRGRGNDAVKRWDAVGARPTSGAWGEAGLRLARTARGKDAGARAPGPDPLADASAAQALNFRDTFQPEQVAEVQAVVDRLGALDAHLVEYLVVARLEAAETPLARDAAVAELADVSRLLGATCRLRVFNSIGHRADLGHWLPLAVGLLDEAIALEPDRADARYMRGNAAFVRGEPAEAVLDCWRGALERDPYLVLEDSGPVAGFIQRHGDTPALREVLALRRTRGR